MKSWIEIKPDSDFSMDNIPFGIGQIPRKGYRICTRLGETIVDLGCLATLGYFDKLGLNCADFEKSFLNEFISKIKC